MVALYHIVLPMFKACDSQLVVCIDILRYYVERRSRRMWTGRLEELYIGEFIETSENIQCIPGISLVHYKNDVAIFLHSVHRYNELRRKKAHVLDMAFMLAIFLLSTLWNLGSTTKYQIVVVFVKREDLLKLSSIGVVGWYICDAKFTSVERHIL